MFDFSYFWTSFPKNLNFRPKKWIFLHKWVIHIWTSGSQIGLFLNQISGSKIDPIFEPMVQKQLCYNYTHLVEKKSLYRNFTTTKSDRTGLILKQIENKKPWKKQKVRDFFVVLWQTIKNGRFQRSKKQSQVWKFPVFVIFIRGENGTSP